MGWASGSELAEQVWSLVRDYIPEGNQRALVARQVIDEFEGYDCDTIDEAEPLCKDARRRTWQDESEDGELYEPLDDESLTPKSVSGD